MTPRIDVQVAVIALDADRLVSAFTVSISYFRPLDLELNMVIQICVTATTLGRRMRRLRRIAARAEDHDSVGHRTQFQLAAPRTGVKSSEIRLAMSLLPASSSGSR